MKERLKAADIWEKYQKDMSYKAGQNLFERVKQQEDFMIGRQWGDLNTPDIEKPTINFIKRVVNWLISVIMSKDIDVSFSGYAPAAAKEQLLSGQIFVKNEQERADEKIICNEIDRINERVKLKSQIRQLLRNAAVDGDACLYVRYNADIQNNQPVQGEIEVEIIDNINVHFGNTHIATVEKQPYIIISRQEPLESLKEQFAWAAEKIKADDENKYMDEKEHPDDMCTVLLYLFKKNGKVHYIECTHDVILSDENAEYSSGIDTQQALYPISYMSWENIKNTYHGIGVVEEIIPNQVAVNKMWSLALLHLRNFAFPKIFFDKTKIDNWTNKVGAAIGVQGPPKDVYATTFRAGDMSSQLMELVEKTIVYSKEFMGANDVVLGNINPTNTSAILATQQSSSAPLELQKICFYQMIEEYVRIVYDIMRSKYGVRYVSGVDDDGVEYAKAINFTNLVINADLVVNIGPSEYWSSITQTATLDNMLSNSVITDLEDYVSRLPDDAVRDKKGLMESIREQKAQQREQQLMQLGVENGQMQLQ